MEANIMPTAPNPALGVGSIGQILFLAHHPVSIKSRATIGPPAKYHRLAMCLSQQLLKLRCRLLF